MSEAQKRIADWCWMLADSRVAYGTSASSCSCRAGLITVWARQGARGAYLRDRPLAGVRTGCSAQKQACCICLHLCLYRLQPSLCSACESSGEYRVSAVHAHEVHRQLLGAPSAAASGLSAAAAAQGRHGAHVCCRTRAPQPAWPGQAPGDAVHVCAAAHRRQEVCRGERPPAAQVRGKQGLQRMRAFAHCCLSANGLIPRPHCRPCLVRTRPELHAGSTTASPTPSTSCRACRPPSRPGCPSRRGRGWRRRWAARSWSTTTPASRTWASRSSRCGPALAGGPRWWCDHAVLSGPALL